jgi:hypothetical protein
MTLEAQPSDVEVCLVESPMHRQPVKRRRQAAGVDGRRPSDYMPNAASTDTICTAVMGLKSLRLARQIYCYTGPAIDPWPSPLAARLD